MAQDYSVPRNLVNSLFGDFQLPEHSAIVTKNRPEDPKNSIAGSKYAQDDDEFLNLQLGEVSKIVHHREPPSASNWERDPSKNKNELKPPKQKSRMTIGARTRKRNNNKKAEPSIKEQVDIDNEIGQVAEWGERGVKNNSDEDEFDQAEQVGQSLQQQEARRRLQQKLKNGFGQKNKGGLKAKAQQLRRQKQFKGEQPTVTSAEKINEANPKHKIEVQKTFSSDHDQTSADLIQSRQRRAPAPVMMEESEDDPWEKVNEKTNQHYQNIQQKRKDMSLDAVLTFYKQQFKFEEADIQLNDSDHAKEQEEKEKGCLEMLFDCFKDDKPKKGTKSNTSLAKRLVAISKKQLTNTEEEYFMLHEIWCKLTNEQFSRYGSQWNKIGFQGRDPATDLRSTGVLSLLQWLLYIEAHPKMAKEQGSWSIQAQYPLALTHIKVTGAFLDLLLKGKIKGQKWDDFQQRYNALIVGVMGRMKSKFDGCDNLGTLVEEQVRALKQNYIKEFSRYDSEHKK